MEGAKCSSRGTWSDFGSFSIFPRSRNCAQIDPILVRRLKKSWRGTGSETTLSSRNHNNPCAVGTSWLLKGHFFDGDWLICCFGCVSLCSVLFEGVWCSNYRHRCPCALGGVASRGFGAGTCRHSCCSNATFLEVYSVSPPPRSHFKRFGLKIVLSLRFGVHVFS